MMSEQEKPPSSSVSVSSEGDVGVDGDVVGRDKVTNVTKNFFLGEATTSSQIPEEEKRRLRLAVHLAVLLRTGTPCYFINATNLSEREIEITHIWLDCDPQVHVLQPDRALPKRLRPDETWETWIEVSKVPSSCEDPYTLAKARLSSGMIVKSERNDDVPSQGFIPGGPIMKEDSGGSSFR